MSDEPIYLDYNATTPPAPEVVEAMIPALREAWGNASSSHAIGRRARAAVDRARRQVAEMIGCEPDELIFTSGGTESDNAAILGVAEALGDRGRHIVVSAVEHAAVAQACRHLEQRGWEIARVPVESTGRVDPSAVADAVGPQTVLVSIMHAQNETGVLQPVAAIGELLRSEDTLLHVDAAQSIGKLPVNVREMGADLLTLAGHKFYGPMGVGALFIRRGTPFEPFLLGAGHEGGRRAGTENVPGIVGFGAACALTTAELPGRTEHLRELRDRLEANLRRRIPDLIVHGSNVDRLPNTLCVALPGVDSNELLAMVPGVASAAGEACHAGQRHVSATLRAMGVPDALALCTLRLTVGRPTTAEEVDRAADLLAEAAIALRGRG
jgi:cysteine desulfurase